METIQHIVIDSTLSGIASDHLTDYLCHAYCSAGSCRFEYNGREFIFQQGDCLIIPSRGNLVKNIRETDDFKTDVIYVTQQFIAIATPQSNYGMKGHLALFDNPVMRLNADQQKQCANNFAVIRRRLASPQHHFYRDILINAVQTMILDFFDFHATMYGADKITTQNNQIMSQFIELLERGGYRKNRDIAYYADKLCVTPKYLSEVAKKVSGLPAAYWITRYTALDISRLLRDRSLSFTDIANMFDFSSLAHFSRYVQNNLGAKPTDFRE